MADAPLLEYSMSFAETVDGVGPTYILPLINVSFPLNNKSPVVFAAFPIRMFVLLVLLGKFTNNPDEAGIENGVVVEIVKSEFGLVRMYRNVPFCNVNQLSVRVLRVPAISIVSVVACEVPLFTVTVLKTVRGVPEVFVTLAELEPKKVTGIPVKSTFEIVLSPWASPSVLLMRFPPIDMA
jgi:hypothetical protein